MPKKNNKPENECRRVTVKEYARKKNIHPSTVTRRIHAGLLRAEQPAKGYRIEILL